jgi:hypothetical protein
MGGDFRGQSEIAGAAAAERQAGARDRQAGSRAALKDHAKASDSKLQASFPAAEHRQRSIMILPRDRPATSGFSLKPGALSHAE